MATKESFARISELLEQTALDASLWRQVCDALAEYLGGIGTVLVPEDIGQQGPWLVASASLDELLHVAFRDNWHLRNFRRRALPLIKQRGYATDFDIADATAMRREPFYSELLRPRKLGHFIGIGFEAGDQTWVASVQRALDAPPPDEELIQRVQRLRPLLAAAARASEVPDELQFENWKELMAEDGRAIFIIDRQGRVLDRNQAAEAYLGKDLILKNRTLQASHPMVDLIFQHLLAAAKASVPAVALPPPVFWRNADAELLIADTVPINRRLTVFHNPAAALIVVRRAEEARLSITDLLKKGVNLTDAEVRLANALFEGQSLTEYAKDVGNTVGTVRQQLKSVFRKTQTNRQAELVTWMRKLESAGRNNLSI